MEGRMKEYWGNWDLRRDPETYDTEQNAYEVDKIIILYGSTLDWK